MSNNKLNIGDIVTFCFSDDTEITGCLDYIPCQHNECWIIIVKNNPVYIQQFDMIQLAGID